MKKKKNEKLKHGKYVFIKSNYFSMEKSSYFSLEKTPIQKSKWSRKQGTRKENTVEDGKMNSHTTPKHIGYPDNDSPVPLTQEGWENRDVIWDWNSPQAKSHPKKSQKRLALSQSPKVPIKRHPSHNSIQNFEKLREELQALREEIAIPDSEDLLRLSPVEEADYKDIRNSNENNQLFEEFQSDNFDELFDGTINAQLIELSQAIESNLNSPGAKIDNTNKKECVVSPSKVYSFKKVDKSDSVSKIANDSFEALIGAVDIEQITGDSSENSTESLKDCVKSNSCTLTYYNNVQKSSGKVEFYRTESFELSRELDEITGIPKEKLSDIERKRNEALAKLRSKRKQEPPLSPTTQCSTEEIENKKRQAFAKLEAKREQEIIERKRQEALKRLQSRKKNAVIVKSSLTKRLI